MTFTIRTKEDLDKFGDWLDAVSRDSNPEVFFEGTLTRSAEKQVWLVSLGGEHRGFLAERADHGIVEGNSYKVLCKYTGYAFLIISVEDLTPTETDLKYIPIFTMTQLQYEIHLKEHMHFILHGEITYRPAYRLAKVELADGSFTYVSLMGKDKSAPSPCPDRTMVEVKAIYNDFILILESVEVKEKV